MRRFKGDKWTRMLGSRIPQGAVVRVLRFFPRRRAVVEYRGEPIATMLWCLERLDRLGKTVREARQR